MKQILVITQKELRGYFGSPMALIFVGVFLAVTMFTFFWIDTFFARGLADVRPLFRWLPLLLIFLVASLTMRQWSEEEHSGTLEILLTLPLRIWQPVLGKFLAVLALVGVALLLTLNLPITAAVLGNLDWGPVVGGYLAALLLAAAYTAIGLFISSRTDNQIVALILTVAVAGLLYFLGTRGLTEFTGTTLGGVLRGLATGSHFESIERGVIDLRDLVYYLTLTLLFLTLNVLSLDSKRWSAGAHTASYRRNAILGTTLVAANLVLLNIWLQPLRPVRVDLTQGREFSLSQATRDLIGNLEEPLLIRGYFSERTHPLLAPLIPRVQDTLREYEIASGGMIEVDFVDPTRDPELEREATESYGIRPSPFRVADRYEDAVVSAYFDILLRYGDQSTVLGFQELIEVESFRSGELDVRLRNLEYDLTRSLRKIVFGFQSVGAVLEALPQPARLTLIVTPETLPADLAEAQSTIESVAEQLQTEADGKFLFETLNPDGEGARLDRQALFEQYNLRPIAASLFSPETYYLHMLLEVGERTQLLFPSGEPAEAEVRTAIEAGLKRASPGFLKVVGLWQPPQTPTTDAFGQTTPPSYRFLMLTDRLRQEYEVRDLDLSGGRVADDIDILVLLAPQGLGDVELYAVDQYLMRGGSVVVAGGSHQLDVAFGSVGLSPLEGGVQQLLSHYGITVEEGLVLDPQNEAFPVPVVRNVGGFPVREIQALDYPYFIDVRRDGMASDSPILAGLQAVVLNWSSPLTIDETKSQGLSVTTLLRSGEESWVRSDTNAQPDLETYPEYGFPVEGERRPHTLAVAIQGTLESFFKDKPNPLLEATDEAEGAVEPEELPYGTLETSPETTRLVIFGSVDFLNDLVFDLSIVGSIDTRLQRLQLMQNVIGWSVEDTDLLSIRSRGTHTQVLRALERSEQTVWESLNYGFALIALLVIGLTGNLWSRRAKPMTLTSQGAAEVEGSRG